MSEGVFLRAHCDFGEEFFRVKIGTTMNGEKYLYIQRCELTVSNCGRAIRDFGKSAFPTLADAMLVKNRMRKEIGI